MTSSFREMASKWPSTVVARAQIARFTGGLLQPGTMANLDSKGLGPHGRIMLGKKSGYMLDALVEWLESQAKELPGKAPR